MPTIFHYLKYIPFLLLFVESAQSQCSNQNGGLSIENLSNVGYINMFEACPGDDVVFTYNGDLGSTTYLTPNKIVFKSGGGTDISIDLIAGTNLFTTLSQIRVTIPTNITTGQVQLNNTNTCIYLSRQNLIINKPLVDIHLPAPPFCATDIIPLTGVPSGGIFSAASPNGPLNSSSVFDSDTGLIGTAIDWTLSVNNQSRYIDIDYEYFPKYTSGDICPNPISTQERILVKDNRLDSFVIPYVIINNTPTIADRIILDTITTNSFFPAFTLHNYSTSFSGNYVNQVNGEYVFFTEDAGYGNHPITLQYDNAGCIGSATATLDILQSLRLYGQVDTLCRDAVPLNISRDSRPEYAYSDITTISGSDTTRIESNIILSVTTRTPAYSNAISTITSTPGLEAYTLDPDSLPNNLNTVFIEMRYRSYSTTVRRPGGLISLDQSPISTVEYPIELVDRPTLSFTIDPIYCKNSAEVQLTSTPNFHVPHTSYTYTTVPSGSVPSVTMPSNKFNPNDIYNQAVPAGSQNQNVNVQLTYTIDRYGCIDSHTENIVIDSVPNPSLNGLAAIYCIHDPLIQLNGLPASSSGSYTGTGIQDTTLGTFSPALAGLGTTTVTYTARSINNCSSSISGTTTIQSTIPPQPSFPETQYCASDSIVQLDTAYTYWGNLIDGTNRLNPQNPNALGQQTIYYIAATGFGCSDTGSTIILINRLPTFVLGGLESDYCFNSSSDDDILISPAVSSYADISGSSPGFSFNPTQGVSFDPQFDTSGVKTFKYKYTDNVTQCTDSIELNITVHDLPVLSYTGIDSTYCNTNSFDSIAGTPSGGVFSGPGISSSTTGQYYFNPALSGGGSQTINYSLDVTPVSTLSCPVEINIPVIINQLPNLAFSGPQNSHRFCSNEPDVALTAISTVPIIERFSSSTPGALYIRIDTTYISTIPYRIIDTAYSFSPYNAGQGVHDITYTVTNPATGCQDSMLFNYYITDYGNGASFQLDSTYCASSDSIPLSGTPSGGIFLRDLDTLHSSFLILNTPIYLSDTITYSVEYGACTSSNTQIVEINPLVDLSFTGNQPSKTYCFGEEDSPLVPNISHGTFSGNAVISGDSLFSLQYAYAGNNIIFYTYIDSITDCKSIVSDTFSVYGMPNIDFNTVGACQSDSIFFHPDNAILGLNNSFGAVILDSITNIGWEVEPGVFISGSNNSSNEINSIHHIYTTPGVYETKLFVTNRIYCTDTAVVQVIISPTINSNQFPYDETFQNSDGNWYPEAKDTSHNSLWEWGKDTIRRGINEPNNNLWVTQLNDQYGANEAAWVYSPCFDISRLDRPMIRLDQWSDSRNRGDGTVLEVQNLDRTWSPLGEVDRGINWFNTDFIAGAPGNQALSPIGWSGKSYGWVNSRYKLDEFKNTLPAKLRLRMSFGSSSTSLGTFYNGFAFDNVWIGNRTRNVLLETTSNIYEPNMDDINNDVYQLVYHTNINQDVILLQYHSEAPNNNDEFHQYNSSIANARTLFYGIFNAGTAFIDGIDNTRSEWLNDLSFEQNMLESPKFKVEIDTFYHTNPDQFTMTSTVTALVNIPTVERYRINMIITEDSLSYSGNGARIHAVVRQDYPSNTTNTFDRSWSVGDQITLTHTYASTGLNYVPNHFQAVAFIQAQKINGREVFQTATTRDVYGYWVGVDQVASEQELNEIKDMTLYPNPAKDYITIDFPEILEKDYKWKLVSIGGITIKEDVIHAGEQSLKIDNYDLPSGVYIFMAYNGHVYSQRKVIINQD